MTVRIYTKNDKVKNIEADIPVIEYLILKDALTIYYKDEETDEPTRAVIIQMLTDMDPEDVEVIDIGDLS